MNYLYWISLGIFIVFLGLAIYHKVRFGKYAVKFIVPAVIFSIPVVLLSALYIYYHIELKPSATTSTVQLESNGIQIGHATRTQPTTLDEYIASVAPQIGVFNRQVGDFWPQASFADVVAYFISSDKEQAWKVNHDGSYEVIEDVRTVPHFGSVYGYEMEFFPLYTQTDGEKGMVIVISDAALLDQKHYEKYTHLGTYDPLLTYIHEGFHIFVQDGAGWEDADISKAQREDALENLEARRLRTYTIDSLYKALQDNINRDLYVKQAIKLYQSYRSLFPDEFERVRYFERIEGSAAYLEVISSLQVSYPSMIDQSNYVDAVTLWTANREAVDSVGSSHEAYELGILAGALLDIYTDPNEWKTMIEEDPQVTPMMLLENIFTSDELNQVEAPDISGDFSDKLVSSISKGRDVNSNLLRFLYNIFFN